MRWFTGLLAAAAFSAATVAGAEAHDYRGGYGGPGIVIVPPSVIIQPPFAYRPPPPRPPVVVERRYYYDAPPRWRGPPPRHWHGDHHRGRDRGRDHPRHW